MRTYAVKWREPGGQTFIGRLSFGSRLLALDGRLSGADEPAVKRQFLYAEVGHLRIGSRGVDRLDGRPALVLEQPDGHYLVADAGMGAPILQELVERLTERLGGRKQIAANPQ